MLLRLAASVTASGLMMLVQGSTVSVATPVATIGAFFRMPTLFCLFSGSLGFRVHGLGTRVRVWVRIVPRVLFLLLVLPVLFVPFFVPFIPFFFVPFFPIPIVTMLGLGVW